MNNFEHLETRVEQLTNETSLKETKLENLDNKFEEKNIEFRNKNAKVMIAAGGLVNGRIADFNSNKEKLESSLASGKNPEKVLQENASDLNMNATTVDASALKGPDGMVRLISALSKGECIAYQNPSGELRVVYGAKMEPAIVDGKEIMRPSFCGYSGDGAVADKTIRSELRELMSNEGSFTHLTEAPSKVQELIRPYDNGMSR